MTGHRTSKVGALLLAAGGSSRLGQPKQLLQFQGKTLLRRSAEMLAASLCYRVVIVIGPDLERSQKELQRLPVKVCSNQQWQSGMSSSIKAGLLDLIDDCPDIEAVMITLCDQLNVTTADIDNFVREFSRTGAPIIAAQYDKVIGVPALFSREMFGKLLRLDGDKGARDLIRSGQNQVVALKLQQASFDVDTLDDAEKLI